jgi:hypothetical protein
MKTSSIDRHSKTVDLAALAFYAGANRVDYGEGVAQIEATHAKMAKELAAARTAEVASLEAQETTLMHLAPQAQERWAQMRERYKEDPPRVIVPLAMGAVGVGAAVAEAIMLAPALDMLLIKDPVLQLVLAIVISLASAVLLHFALDAYRKQAPSSLPLFCAAGAALMGLVLFGIWRAQAVAFAATHGKGPLGPFFSEWSGLTTLVICFITLVIPLAAAFAIGYALNHVWQWWEFRKARRGASRLKTALDSATKQVESAKKQLALEIDQIKHRNEEWQAQYKHYWQLGHENGARRGPAWRVYMKSAAVALGVIACGVVLSLLGISSAVLGGGIAGIAAGLAAAAYFHHQWEHPTPEQFLKNANTRFTDGGAQSEVRPGAFIRNNPRHESPSLDSEMQELLCRVKGEA